MLGAYMYICTNTLVCYFITTATFIALLYWAALICSLPSLYQLYQHLTSTDVARYSVVQFLHNEITVLKMQNQLPWIFIPLHRTGNLDQISRIRCILVEDTAKAGIDFWKPPYPQRGMFPVGSDSRNCTVMLSKEKTERRKSFTVILEAGDNHTVILTDSMRVHIEGECRGIHYRTRRSGVCI